MRLCHLSEMISFMYQKGYFLGLSSGSQKFLKLKLFLILTPLRRNKTMLALKCISCLQSHIAFLKVEENKSDL